MWPHHRAQLGALPSSRPIRREPLLGGLRGLGARQFQLCRMQLRRRRFGLRYRRGQSALKILGARLAIAELRGKDAAALLGRP